MPKKLLGAILLPLPFAALPVIVVLIGAIFGPGGSDALVTREAPAPFVIEDTVSTEALTDETIDLASLASPLQFDPGCNDYDLRSES